MTETVLALVDADGVVVNTIVAPDPSYAATLETMVADPKVDTGPVRFAQALDVTGKSVGVGHRRAASGKFTPPPAPELTAAQRADLDAAAAAETARRDADAFLATLDAKLAAGGQLTQTERDRKDVIAARRSAVTPPPAAAPGKP